MATTTLQLYWDLASYDASVRQSAAHSLIRTLADFQKTHEASLSEQGVADTEETLDALCASDVSYAVRRLLRGLPSSRQGARQGFSLALTELLAIVDVISLKVVLDLLFKYTERTGSMSGEEVRDMLFGRLFGLMSIVASGMMTRESTQTEDIVRMIESLHDMATAKSYLAEVCHHVVVNILPHLKDSQHKDTVIEKIKELFFKGPIINVDQLNLVIGIQNSLPEIDVSEQFSNWKSQNILELPNLARLASILKEIPADTQEALADWKPQLHSVWDPILSIYLDGGENKNIASFQEFWTIAVDNTMFDKNASHGRKFWGFQLVERVLPRLSSEQMPLIFTANFMRTFINNLSSDVRFLNKAARHTAHAIHNVAQENKQVGFALITQLLGKNGHQHFDRITKTKTVENLLTTMDATNIKSYLEYLAHTFTKSNADDTTSREWALNQMSLLITSAKIPKEESWVTDLVKFLMTFAFFEVKTSEKKSTYLSGTHIPSPALTFPNIKHCQDRFQDVLVALSKLPPSEKVKDNAVLKSRKLNGFTNAGELWAYQVYEIYKGLQKNKKLVSLVTPSEKAVTATKKAMAIVADLRAKIAKMDKAIVNDSVERGFEILFLNLVLHSLINESEGVSVLMELTDCYEKTFAKKTKAKKGKKGAKKQEEEEEEEQLDPIDVIVDILVSFLTNESPVLKSLAEQVFEIFSHKLTKQSLEMLLNILGSGDGKQGDDDLLQGAGEEDEEEDEEEDDIEMVDMSDVEEVDDEEENGDVDEELRRKIAEAMQSEGIDANDESDEEIDDAAMAAFDEKLAEVFQQKKNLKEEKKDFQRNVVHFKNNVMELIVIYARKNPTNPLVLELIVPLLQVIRDTPAKSVSNQFSTKVISFLKNKLAKATDYPHATDDYVFEILQAVHDFAKHSTSKDLSDMCNQLSLYLRKCIVGGADFEVDAKTPKETKAALAKMLAIYSSSIKLYMSKKNTHFHASIIQSLLQRYPLSSWGLLETLIVYLNRNECCNVYRLGMACQWTSVIIQRTVGKKSDVYNEKFIAVVPQIAQAVKDTIDSSLKDEAKSLDSDAMRNYMRYIVVIVKLQKKVSPKTADLKSMWDTELILSVVNNEKYTKPTIAASCKALEQCWA